MYRIVEAFVKLLGGGPPPDCTHLGLRFTFQFWVAKGGNLRLISCQG